MRWFDGEKKYFFNEAEFSSEDWAPILCVDCCFSLSNMTFKLFLQNCGIEMRGCWKGPISPLQAARGNYGRRRFLNAW